MNPGKILSGTFYGILWSFYQLSCQKIDGELSISFLASCWDLRKDAGSALHRENTAFQGTVNHPELLVENVSSGQRTKAKKSGKG